MSVLPARADDLIFQRRMEFDKEGVASDEVTGSPIVTLANGKEFVVGVRNLRADDGTVYGIDYDLGQASESAPMDATVRVWRLDAPAADADALAEQYSEVNPDASADELALMKEGMADAHGSGIKREVSVADDLREWAVADIDSDRRTVTAILYGGPGLDLPPPVDDLLDVDPVAALDRMESRLLAVEEYQTSVDEFQKSVIAELEEAGATVTSAGWLADSLSFEVDSATAGTLLEDSRFDRLDFEARPTPDSNDGIATRASTQLTQFVQSAYVGERATGLNSKSDVFVAVVDDCVDEDHPAWNDTSAGSPRLGTVWRWDTGAYRALLSTEDSATGTCHGNGVSGILLSDLTDGQDASVTAATVQSNRSGIALEATFDFIEQSGSTFADQMAKVADLNPDVVNLSFGENNNCSNDHANIPIVDALFAFDILVAKSAGNSGHTWNHACSVSAPAQAAAVLVAGGLETSGVADLQAGTLATDSSIGGDAHGRPLIDLVAPGRETSNLPVWNNAYQTSAAFTQTSAAAPTLAGAVANMKDLLSTFLTASLYNDVGNLYATMLLMGDGTLSACAPASLCNSPGATATHGDALDPRWGAGRLRMRMFTDDGMDGPWRARWCVRTITQGSTGTCLTNPDSYGVNQALSSDVERLRAAAYWFEPNLGSLEDAANIAFAAYKNGGFQYQTSGTAPGKKRLREDAANGATWEVRAIGWCVPATDALYDASHPYANCVGDSSRTVHIALYWEDMDRETLDQGIQ